MVTNSEQYTAAATTIKSILLGFYIVIASYINSLGLGDSPIFISFSILLLIDYFTGLLKAYALGESITSNKMKYGIVSKLIIIILPFIFKIAAKGAGSDVENLMDTMLLILMLSEVYSIIANMYSIKTGKELPEFDVISILGKKIRDYLLRLSGDKDEK